jgi:uncharacterized protein
VKLDGARVVITGASRGIGEGLATEFAARGAQVALVARSEDALKKLAADLGGDAYAADLADASTIEPLVQRIEADGAIDVLVNNAGVDLAGVFTDLPSEAIEQLIAVNLVAPMLLSRAVIPGMRARGRGQIVNISSMAATNALPGLAPYSSSKAGLSHFTAGLRAELKGTPLTTTLVELGPVVGTMIDNLRTNERTRKALHRMATLRLAVDLDPADVVDGIVQAVENERRHLRMPKRDILFPMLCESPRRMTEWLLAGVK